MSKNTNRNPIEHVNLTVADPTAMAERLVRLFDWHIRWQGASPAGGFVVHVGSDSSYLALYRPPGSLAETDSGSSMTRRGFNHLGVVVSDLDQVEQRVREEGLQPYGHEDYDPGRRFYFMDAEGIEFEVVSY